MVYTISDELRKPRRGAMFITTNRLGKIKYGFFKTDPKTQLVPPYAGVSE